MPCRHDAPTYVALNLRDARDAPRRGRCLGRFRHFISLDVSVMLFYYLFAYHLCSICVGRLCRSLPVSDMERFLKQSSCAGAAAKVRRNVIIIVRLTA